MSQETVTLSGPALSGVMPGVQSFAALPEQVRLGRKRRQAYPVAPRLGAYLGAAAGPPAFTNRRTSAARALARMYRNDALGCCVVAGKAHALGLWAAAESAADVEATDDEIVSQYEGICGPGDQGCVITEVLDVMRARGFVAGGKSYVIDGYVSCDWRNKLEAQVAVYLFGALTIGVNLPQAWTQQAVWDVTNSRIVGGHDVTVIDYDAQGVYVASWGRVYLLTWRAFQATAWVEECYALLAPLWYASARVAPCGIDADTLRADLAKLGGGVIPDVGPVTPPPGPSGLVDASKIVIPGYRLVPAQAEPPGNPPPAPSGPPEGWRFAEDQPARGGRLVHTNRPTTETVMEHHDDLKAKLTAHGVHDEARHQDAQAAHAAGLGAAEILALVAQFGPVALEIIGKFLKNRRPPAPAA